MLKFRMRSALYSTMGMSLLVGSFFVGTSDICSGGTRGVREIRSGAKEATEERSSIATTTDAVSFIMMLLLVVVVHRKRMRDSGNKMDKEMERKAVKRKKVE